MKEFFYQVNSFAAPIISDVKTGFISGETPDEALTTVVQTYKHPCGLYAVSLWEDANTYHKKEKAIRTWLSEKAYKDQRP